MQLLEYYMLGSGVMLALLTVLVGYLTFRMVRDNPFARGNKSGGILVDTSVLIDGRIVSIAQSGFITELLVIPRSVIRELQYLADNSDSEKRARARHGMDNVRTLQAMDTVDVTVLPDDNSKRRDGVDEHLLRLARDSGASICTIDYNLIKVAEIEKIHILNINELSQGLRISHLPGEHLVLELVQKGQDSHQAVGYLPDGTMVVVENAHSRIGSTVELEIIRSIQTVAGKMLFAKLASDKQKPEQKKQPAGRKIVQKIIDKKPSQRPKTASTGNKPQQPAAKPSQSSQRAEKVQQPAQQQPAVKAYHATPRRDKTQRTQPAKQSQSAKQPQTAKPATKPSRPKTSKQREDSLVNLINSQ